ncbi:Ig-like domain-containing protein [Aquella oligotrophica]|uniref:SbsA Ig-like domain-containing protein n=1 Tax=Aquella oligotrophica TaxID=2067065 RepID=A0A2I7N8J3_9NEIS|nr:Ig-like domain-containing protein [Aquella oligotrophica]AUR52784.1 hypothetical protein CUN60_10935 [Aquella oligotrophica]
MKFFISQLNKKLLQSLFIGTIFLGITACTGNKQPNDNNQFLDRQILIDTVGTIPVINGKSTNSGVYIHNLSSITINNINYHVINGTTDYKLELDNKETCSEIAPGGSCLLKFTTPELNPSDAGSALLVAEYNGKQTKQLLNYQYIDRHNYQRVSFSNPLIQLDRSHPYATVYAFNPLINQGYSGKLEMDNTSSQIVNGIKDNKLILAANQVLPIEIKLADMIMDKRTSMYLAEDTEQPVMQIMVSPENKANLLVSNSGVLDLTKTTIGKFTLYNNGVSTATNINLIADNANKIMISPDSENGCIQGGDLEAGASCNYQLTVLDKNGSDVRVLYLSYNNGINEIREAHSLAYIGDTKQPSLRIAPEISKLNIDGGNVAQVKFILNNIGDLSLEGIQNILRSTQLQSTVGINTVTSNCKDTLAAGSSCQITAQIDAVSNWNESGIIYLSTEGYNSIKTTKHYNFVSLPLKVEVTDKTQLALTDFRPLNEANNIRINTELELFFNKPVKLDSMISPNIELETNAGEKVTLESGVAITDQHISLKPDTTLKENTQYKIVINQTAIMDQNGKPLGNDSHYIVGSFTTGDFTAPTIINFAPTNGQSNVSTTNPDIFVRFSEAMDTSTINTNSIYLESDIGKVKFTGISTRIESGESMVRVILSNGNELAKKVQYNLIIDETQIKDKAGNPVGNNSKTILSSFATNNGNAPKVEQTQGTVRSSFAKVINGILYDNTDDTGGSATEIRLSLGFRNQDMTRIIDKIELNNTTKSKLTQLDMILVSDTCQQKLAYNQYCSISYRLPGNVRRNPANFDFNFTWGYNIYTDNSQNIYSIELPKSPWQNIAIVNPTFTIESFVQIKDASKTILLNFTNLYNPNLGGNDINIGRPKSGQTCATYDSKNASQQCSSNMVADSYTGKKTLTVTAWSIVTVSQDYEVARLIYVTQNKYTGNLGGVSGANQKCQAEAPTGTTAKALLELSRPTIKGARYFNVYDDFVGTALDNNTFRSDGSLESAIDINKDATTWYGSAANPDRDCSNWTMTGVAWASTGSSKYSTAQWNSFGSAQCGATLSLFCVTQ